MSRLTELESENTALRRRIAALETTPSGNAAADLQASEARYRLLADHAGDVIWVLDLRSKRFTYVSPSVVKLRGYTPAEVSVQTMDQVLTPASLALVDAELPPRLQQFLAGDPSAVTQRHELEQTCKNGATIWTEVTTTLVQQSDGALQVVGVSRDIAERKRIESQLVEARQTLEQRVANRTEALGQANARLARTLKDAQVLYQVGAALIEIEKLDDALQHAVDLLADALAIDRVSMITFDTGRRLVTGFHKGGAGSESLVQASFAELWEGLSGWALRELKPALSPKGMPDPRESSVVQARRAATNCGSIIVAPVIFQGKILGTLTAINRLDQPDFEQQDVELLQSLANPLAAAIENNRLYLAMAAEVKGRQRAQAELQDAYAAAERLVAERTGALVLTNQALEQQISERVRVEETLRRSEENLKQAQAVAHTGSWVQDIARSRLEWSEETYRLFGVPPGTEVHQEDFVARVHPEDRAAVAAAWDAALRGDPYGIEHRIANEGSVRWVWEQAELEFDAQGTPIRGVGIVQDITERKLAEAALQEGEERYRVIFEGAKEGIVAINHTRNAFAFVNPAMCALFGYAPAEFMRLGVSDLHPAASLPHVLAEFSALTAGKKAQVENIPCQRKDGALFYTDIKAATAVINGEPFTIGFFHDVTARRRSDALLQARLRLSTLAPDASLDELLQKTLDAAEDVTASAIGYFHFLEDDQVTLSLQNWSTNTLAHLCTAEGKGEHYAVDLAGVWADAVREAKQ